jgi:hypothetical protein
LLWQKQPRENSSGAYAKDEISDAGCPGKSRSPDGPESQVPADCIRADEPVKIFDLVHQSSLWSSASIAAMKERDV